MIRARFDTSVFGAESRRESPILVITFHFVANKRHDLANFASGQFSSALIHDRENFSHFQSPVIK